MAKTLPLANSRSYSRESIIIQFPTGRENFSESYCLQRNYYNELRVLAAFQILLRRQ